jgi:hypothetical protein
VPPVSKNKALYGEVLMAVAGVVAGGVAVPGGPCQRRRKTSGSGDTL